MSSRYKQLKFKAWDISKPLPVKPEPNTVFIVKDEDEFIIEVVDSRCNYLSQKNSGENIYGTELNVFQNKSILNNSTSDLQEALNVNTTELPTGKYTLKVDYSWNTNCTQHDFESYLTFNGFSVSNDNSGLIHREEPKDSAGQWENTNSRQILNFSREYTIDITGSGVRNIILSFKSSKSNVMASIWDVNVKIFRIS